tara:strand:+ start:203 stop:859 length:657 start_codon:yes stop_codon:yes gene_type:complete
MPPKKKTLKTEEEPNITEEPIVEETMEAPKPKKKRVMSEAQKKNFAKLQEANKIRYEARRKAKEANGEPVKEKNGKNVNEEILEDKEAYIQKEITKKKTQMRNVKKQIQEVESDEEPEVQIVKKTKKKKKPRIIVEDDSSDSDQEIVISRRRKNKKVVAQNIPPPSKPIDIPTNHNDTPKEELNKEEETAPIEKEKKEKKIPELKEYTHIQILKGLGL